MHMFKWIKKKFLYLKIARMKNPKKKNNGSEIDD